MSPAAAWQHAVVTAVRGLTPTVREISLQFPAPVHAAPGAHINVEVVVEGLPDTRSYSVVRSAADGRAVIAVKRVENSRGGSRYMWTLEPGARLKATAPVSQFEPSYGAPAYLLVAGGIGVTPMPSLARALRQTGARPRLLYAVRNPEERAYAAELAELAGDDLRVYVASEGQGIDIPAEIDALPQAGQLYMCGPMGLMDAVRSHWARAGRDAALLRYENFGSGGRHAPQSFTVHVPRLGVQVQVAQDRSMLDALNDAGVATLFNCRRGECGLCAVDVVGLTGDIDHRDVFFSDEQHKSNTKICACVSRVVNGDITIDPAWRGDPDLSRPEVLEGGVTA